MNVGIAIFMLAIVHVAETPSAIAIPLRPDPPIAVDGVLDEWTTMPNAMVIDKPEQVVWGSGGWQSPADLSGIVHLAWRAECLFVAAEVTDDNLRQTRRGDTIWQGDHVELYVDAQPDLDPARDAFGDGQFQIALSPGNFFNSGDPLIDCPPEAFIYRPHGTSVSEIAVAAKPTAAGYALEAAIPWNVLGVAKPAEGTPLRIEAGISDTDGPDARQESLMTTSSGKWGHTRSRLRAAVLARTDGTVPASESPTIVFDALQLEQGGKQIFTFTMKPAPEGKQAVLAFDARLHTERPAGFTSALRLTLNDKPVTMAMLANKPARVKSRGGDVYSTGGGNVFNVFYAPDYTSVDADPHYGLLDGIRACSFEWDVTGLVYAGENTLILENVAAASVKNPLIAANGRVSFRIPPPAAKAKAGPPTGELPFIEPSVAAVAYEVEEKPDAVIEVKLNDEIFRIESQFSMPVSTWAHTACAFFDHQRAIERRPEALVVRDTWTNRTNEQLPLIHRHQLVLGERLRKVWLSGLEQSAGSGSRGDPSNPTTFAATEKQGIGLLPLDDVFRVHIANFAASGHAGIADNNLVLRPGATYTAEWAIIPAAAPDYWTFLNAVRRLLDANFTIEGGFAFLRSGPLTDAWSDEQIAHFLRFKSARWACASIDYPRYKGQYTHGTSFQEVPHDNYTASFNRWRSLAPGTQCLVYFHCFIDVLDEAPERYADARLLRPDGRQADYGKPHDRIFIPTETNRYGAAIAKNIDIIFDEIGAEGVYWDEHEYSRWHYHYGDPWDGCSGDIDPVKFTLGGLKSSVTLLSESWRVALAKRILQRGPLVGNGPPVTRAMAALRFPCFVETGSITHCTQAHLHSPIALGDHLTERNEADAYAVMLAALDYGCVYHWYGDVTVIPTHPHLTQYMFPITPIELHEGYIIGQERIVTKKSGCYGWGDASHHETHVFDDTGREQADFVVPTVERDGNRFSEIRIPEGWSAAIVRLQ
ncbi:MAG TPA: sugar-binding protein [Candidatus Hydrogenedentes bacterium]|nr:sugar-binding protein [Candidatus Hydrogenedentota bacterium]HRT19103.1 sugar-binding protein [Candidatus Hydrogenedentota bacterium]HRT64032.1 sugar-binding protein [Candidatus Hydrogenedentota bacterium]